MEKQGQGMAEGTPEDVAGNWKIAEVSEGNEWNARIGHINMCLGSVGMHCALLPDDWSDSFPVREAPRQKEQDHEWVWGTVPICQIWVLERKRSRIKTKRWNINEAKKIMGGRVLKFPADKVFNEGKSEGRKEERKEWLEKEREWKNKDKEWQNKDKEWKNKDK